MKSIRRDLPPGGPRGQRPRPSPLRHRTLIHLLLPQFLVFLGALLLLPPLYTWAHEVIPAGDQASINLAINDTGTIQVIDIGSCSAVMEVEVAEPPPGELPVATLQNPMAQVGAYGAWNIIGLRPGRATVRVRWAGNAPPDCTEVGEHTFELVVHNTPGEPVEGGIGIPEPLIEILGTVGSYWADFPDLAYTFISVTNVGSASETVTVTFYDEGGTGVANTSMPIAPGGTWRLASAGGGGPPETAGLTGSLRMTGSSGNPDTLLPWSAIFFPGSTSGFTGTWATTGGEREQSTPVPRLTSSFIADFPGLAYTFLSVTNTDTQAEGVTVSFYNDSGTEVASISSTVGSGATWVLPTAGGGGPPATAGMTGHVEVSSGDGDSSNLLPWAAIFFPATTSGFTATWTSR